MTSEEIKTEFVNNIVMKMWDSVGEDQGKRLQAFLFASLAGYELVPTQTSMTVYDEDKAVRYIEKFLIDKKIKGCTDMSGHRNSNRGPCGMPRNEFGTSPFTVGIGSQGFCKSDPLYCSECPANPNRTKERGERGNMARDLDGR